VYEGVVQDLIDELGRLPGVGPKSAQRMAFYLLAAWLLLTRRPPVPPTLPATSDVGPEPPAVANLLANGGRVTPDAVPATLLDLAARRVVGIEETQPGVYDCRLRPSPGVPLRTWRTTRRSGSPGLSTP